MKAIVGAMHGHEDSWGVQEFRCSALHQLSTLLVSHNAAVHEGGIEAVVHAMNWGFQDPEIQLNGCSILSNLCSTDTCREAVRQRGGIKALEHALKTHADNADVHSVASAALQALACREWYVLVRVCVCV